MKKFSFEILGRRLSHLPQLRFGIHQAGETAMRKPFRGFNIIIGLLLAGISLQAYAQVENLKIHSVVVDRPEGLIYIGGENFLLGTASKPEVELAGQALGVLSASETLIKARLPKILTDGEYRVVVRMSPLFSASIGSLNGDDIDIATDTYSLTVLSTVQGEQGPAGVPGPAGPRGVKGETGSVGPQGIRGEQGPQGVAGPVGSKGDKGDAGPQGISGVQGPQGDKGDKGDKGEAGVAGPKGGPGESGLDGTAGLACWDLNGDGSQDDLNGAAGDEDVNNDDVVDVNDCRGQKGDAGEHGEPGPAGPPGAQGEAGAQGSAGPQGVPGPAGPQGAQGSAGPQGIPGPAGPQGAQGPEGPQGAAGVTWGAPPWEVVVVEDGNGCVSQAGCSAFAPCPSGSQLLACDGSYTWSKIDDYDQTGMHAGLSMDRWSDFSRMTCTISIGQKRAIDATYYNYSLHVEARATCLVSETN